MKRIHREKELSEVQVLRLENKALRAQVKNLKKENKRLSRAEHHHNEYKYTDIEDNAQLPLFEEEKQLLCPECFKGALIEMNVVGRNWSYCNQCDYDTRKKK